MTSCILFLKFPVLTPQHLKSHNEFIAPSSESTLKCWDIPHLSPPLNSELFEGRNCDSIITQPPELAKGPGTY